MAYHFRGVDRGGFMHKVYNGQKKELRSLYNNTSMRLTQTKSWPLVKVRVKVQEVNGCD